jgi:hypothetical protein
VKETGVIMAETYMFVGRAVNKNGMVFLIDMNEVYKVLKNKVIMIHDRMANVVFDVDEG